MPRALLLLIVIAFQVSCSLIPFRSPGKVGPGMHLTVSVLDTVNQDRPIEVDVVMVYDKELVEELKNLPAKEWFQSRYQIENDSLGAQRLEFSTWEWTPGQLVEPIDLLFSKKGRAAIIYANYATPGEHRVFIERHSRVRVVLGEQTLEVEALE